MLRAVLFDLDDTLLGNAMDQFLPQYFHRLTGHLKHLVPPERLMRELERGVAAMDAHENRRLTNEEAFASAFYPALDVDPSALEMGFESFYREKFPRLRDLTQRRPEARCLVSSAFEHGLRVVVATNPLFPRIAVEERLAWAGVPVDEFDYDLVTTYETMHGTKSSPAYYREILTRLDVSAGDALMVGDDWRMDVVPASLEGLQTYWITRGDPVPAASTSLIGWGTLSELWTLVEVQGWTFQGS